MQAHPPRSNATRALHLALLVAAILVGVKWLLRTPAPETPLEPPPPPLAFATDTQEPVFTLSVVDPDVEDKTVFLLSLMPDGRMDTHRPTWDAARDKPTAAEQEQGYCLRQGELRFAPTLQLRLGPAAQQALLVALAAAGLDTPTGSAWQSCQVQPGRIGALRYRSVPGLLTTRLVVRTNRGVGRYEAPRLDQQAECYAAANRAQLDAFLALRALAVRLAATACAKRVEVFDQQQLLNLLLQGKTAEVQAAGRSLWCCGNEEIAGQILRIFQESARAKTVLDVGVVLSGFGRRGVALSAITPVMLARLRDRAVHGSAAGARLCFAMQWCGVFAGPDAVEPLLAWFEDREQVRWKMLAPAPFVDPLLRYPSTGKQRTFALVRPRTLAGAVLVRLARRGQAPAMLRTRLLALLQDKAFQQDAHRMDTALKILAWVADREVVETLIRQAAEILPRDVETRVDYGVVLPVVDAVRMDDLLWDCMQAKPGPDAWQLYNLLSCARFPDTPVMRRIWHQALGSQREPAGGARRLRELAARELWRVKDETALAELVKILVAGVEADTVHPYNLQGLPWDWQGTSALLTALRARADDPKMKRLQIWLEKQTGMAAPEPEEEEEIF